MVDFKGQKRSDKLHHQTASSRQKSEFWEAERSRFLTTLEKSSASLKQKLQQYHEFMKELRILRSRGIGDLVTYIFPITEILPKAYVVTPHLALSGFKRQMFFF